MTHPFQNKFGYPGEAVEEQSAGDWNQSWHGSTVATDYQ
jgi:hypothetical protein